MIVGLIAFGGLLIYLTLSVALILLGFRITQANGKPGWKGGLIVAVIMYLLLFWDWIPMRLTHKYLCIKDAGFMVNKTLDEWKLENPVVAETLMSEQNPAPIIKGNRQRYILNQRFSWDSQTSTSLFGIHERDERIVDLKTGEVMARHIDFNSGQNQHNPQGLRDFKFWLYTESCEGDNTRPIERSFYEFKNLFKHQRENK